MKHHQHRRHGIAMGLGFTLIELLVVISIISLLIAILLPALAKARKSAQNVLCLTNVRQIAVAMEGYAADSRGFHPAPNTGTYVWSTVGKKWDDSLWTYLGGQSRNYDIAPANPLKVLQCPFDIAERTSANAKHFISYTLNGGQPGLSATWFQNPRRFEDMEKVSNASPINRGPDGLINLVDSHWWQRQGEEWAVRYTSQYNDGANYYSYHNEGKSANALFFDGHARAVIREEDLATKSAMVFYRVNH